MRFSLKFWFNLIGGGIGLVGVFYVVLQLYTYAGQINLSHFSILDWSIIGLLAIVYGLANFLLARAWWNLVGGGNVSWLWTFKAYGQSQIAKYVPGNIFHLASRQALGMAAGLSARPLAKSMLWELGLLVVGGGLFSVLVIPLFLPMLPWQTFVLFVAIILILILCLYNLISSFAAVALLWQIIFLFFSGAVFIGTLQVVVSATTLLPACSILCGAYVIAWLAGFVTPGAPAGVGVRELVLLYLLGQQVAQVDLLMAVVLGRMATVSGDLFFFMITLFVKPAGGIHE